MRKIQISSKYPQFDTRGERVLFIAASKQHCEVYKVGKGNITKTYEFHVEKPTHLERDSQFGNRGVGVGSASIQDMRDDEIKRLFERELKKIVKELSQKYNPTQIYLYATPKTVSTVKGALPKDWQVAIKKTIRGNFTNEHPFVLLDKLIAAS